MRFIQGIVFLCGIVCYSVVRSDSPSPEPYSYVVCSKRTIYCAHVSPEDGIKVFLAEEGAKHADSLYKVSVWNELIYISDNGKMLVSVLHWFVSEPDSKVPIIRVWKEGKQIRDYFLSEIVGQKKLEKTVSYYIWARSIKGIAENEVFVIELYDGSFVELKLDETK